MISSVRPSVSLSVCHTFLTMFPSSYHPDIFRSYYQWQIWKDQGQRAKIKLTVVKTQFSPFRTVTPVWVHIWRSNYTLSLLFRRGVVLLFKVKRQISRPYGLTINNLNSIWVRLLGLSLLFNPSDLPCCDKNIHTYAHIKTRPPWT